jgi:Reverse transcriptase (RNA-dependent DNA polymerase)
VCGSSDLLVYPPPEQQHFYSVLPLPAVAASRGFFFSLPLLTGNYRPITVLNMYYKILTKAIATCLTEIALSIIHPDQAGFIRGRSIFGQIDQTATTINYAKLEGINRAIVVLDQEKAYDKITHPYLWKILEKFAFPTRTINMIKALCRGTRCRAYYLALV